MPRPLWISVEPVECPTPSGNPMHRYFIIHVGAGPALPRKGYDFDVVTTPEKFVREHAYMEIAPTDQGWRIRVDGLDDADQTACLQFGLIFISTMIG